MKTALVYDRVNKWGGAERVMLALHALFPDAPIYTSVYSKEKAVWAKSIKIIPSFLQQIPFARGNHELLAPLMPFAFESMNFDEYDVVISVTSEAAKGIITKPSTYHICICLTPTRYLWSGYNEYFSNNFIKTMSRPVISYLRNWDRNAAQRPDSYIAISQTVQARIQKYYNRDSEIIYPPVDLKLHKIQAKRQDFFLVVSRLSRFVPYKKIDIAIKAANLLKVPLKIIGEGRDSNYFQKFAGPTVEIVGKVSDESLSEYYSTCRALLFPGLEDFGLVMVEAQAHGAPVIAYRGGGAVEIIREGVTGEFFNRQTIQSLAAIMENFSEKKYNQKKCIQNAKRFSRSVFDEKIRSYIVSRVKSRK